MKLIYCTECDDTVRLITEHVRSCECGNIKGVYINDLDARFTTKTTNYLMIGYANSTFVKAINDYRQHGSPDGWGLNFSAFVIPEPCSTMKRVSEKEFESYK